MSSEFKAVITRKRFCALVRIHATTLKRWERADVVRPKMRTVIGIRTATFTEADVSLGREVAKLLRENHGQLSLGEALSRARRNRRA